MKAVQTITEDQLKNIKECQNSLNNILINIGSIETQKHGMLHKLTEVNLQLEQLKKELEAEYGAVSINLEDGSYEYVTGDKE
tara:strand:+ start:191 stop:436 length:246 start_codon:yes stop_codon:yes gene_type:complete